MKDIVKILRLAGSTRCDHGNVSGFGNRRGESAVEAALDTVRIHRSKENLSGSEILAAARPIDGVNSLIVAAAAGEDAPGVSGAARVDRQDDGLGSKFAAEFRNELGPPNRRGIDADLVGSGMQNRARAVNGSNSSPDGERDEHFTGCAGDDVNHGRAVVARGSDVEEDQLIGALLVVAGGQFNGISGVAEVDEVHSLHDASAGHVETRNDALHEHTKFFTTCSPAAPDF